MFRSGQWAIWGLLRATAFVFAFSFLAVGAGAAIASSGADDSAEFEAIRAADLRLAGIGMRLAAANVALCDRLEPGTGVQLHTLDQYGAADRPKAKAHFRFATEVAIEGIVPGSPAERAGLKADDSLVRMGPIRIADLPGKPMSTDRLVAAQLGIADLPPDAPIEVEVLRGGEPVRVVVQPIPVCRSRFEMDNGYAAAADGTMVRIGARFVEEYPEDLLAALVAHELSHNILRHRVRLEAHGVNYGMFAGFGGNVKYFRQTELQADLLGTALLANAGYSPRAMAGFFSRFGPNGMGSILNARTHPAWRDRRATVEREAARIETVAGRPIVPTLIQERDTPLDGNWQVLLVRHR